MPKFLEHNDILLYFTHNEGKPVIAERFIKQLKPKIYEKMTATNSKSYLAYLNKLVDQCNNIYHHSINKKLINTDDSALTVKNETSLKLKTPKFKIK